MKTWLRHILIMVLALLVYYAVAFVVIYVTLTNPPIAAAIIGDGYTVETYISVSIGALFIIPAIMAALGAFLSKWIAF